MDSLSDATLFSMIQEDDKVAFNMLFDRHWKNLYSFSLHVFQKHELCEDAIQEVFVSLWEKRHQLEIRNIKAYLFQAVKYQIAANLRQVKFIELHVQTIDKLTHIRDVEEQINYQELQTRLEGILNELPARCREIFYLSRFKDMSNQQIADHFSISKRTVENQITRALQKINTSIETSHFFCLFFLSSYFMP